MLCYARITATTLVLVWMGCMSAQAADLRVVVTSKPIHALTAAIMEGVGRPVLLVEGSASPHTFSLKPSAARAITSADVFIRVSAEIEPFTERITAALPPSVTLLTLAATPGLVLLDRRTGATFEVPEHKDHAGHGHDEHDHAGSTDGHIWLDPVNASLMAGNVARVLSAKDPSHADLYDANRVKLAARIDALATEILVMTAPLKSRPFIVFHDAYQYFERRFGLSAIGSVTVSPDIKPSAQRISALRAKVSKLDATCVFAEPMFQPNMVAAITEGTNARAGTLDPEGLSLEPGPELYFTLLRTLATNLTACLKPSA